MGASGRAWLSYSNVMATIAVFIALGGGAFAAVKLKRNQVKTKNIAPNAVTGAKALESSFAEVPSAAHARSADSAPNAANATNATNAANATNAQLATELQFFGQTVWNGANTDDFNPIAANSCFEQDVAADAAVPGDWVILSVNGGAATNPLPAGISATALVETGKVRLRLCNVTTVASSAFNLDWSFVVLHRTPTD